MSNKRYLKSIVSIAACALVFVIAAGCSSAASSASSSAASASSIAASSSSASSSAASSSAASSGSQQSSSASSSAATLTEEEAVAQGYQVFKGTVRVCTAEELIKLQGVDIDPAAAGGGGTYAVLVLDQPTQVTGEQADGSGQTTRTAKVLGIAEHTDYSSFVVEYGDLDACKALDGQQATVAAKAKDIMFPSDVRLPINEPAASSSVFIK